MALNNYPTKKIYHSISEVAKIFNVNKSLIRFWEKKFSIINPKKNKKGNRSYTDKDIENLKIIFHLVKERRYTIEGAKKKLRENKYDINNNFKIVNKLKEIRAELIDIRENL